MPEPRIALRRGRQPRRPVRGPRRSRRTTKDDRLVLIPLERDRPHRPAPRSRHPAVAKARLPSTPSTRGPTSAETGTWRLSAAASAGRRRGGSSRRSASGSRRSWGASCGVLLGQAEAGGEGDRRRRAPRAASSGSAASSGVSKRPGAIVIDADAAAGQVAGGGQGQADDAALRGRVGDLADLAVEGGDRGGVDADAALAARRRGRCRSSPSQARRSTLKVPIRLTLITLWKISRSCGPCLPAVRWAQPMPGAADRDPQAALGLGGGVDRRLDRLGLHHVRLDEAGAVAELGGQRLALLGVEVGDHDRGARARAARGRWRRRARRPRRRPARSLPRSSSARQLLRAPALALGVSLACRRSSAPAPRPPTSKDAIAERLAEARARTLQLIEPLADEQLNRVYSPILSPLIWDLGHIANFEELWLVQRIGGREPLRGELGRLLRRDREPAQDPRRAADPARPTRCAPTWRRCASAPWRCWTRSSSTPATRCWRDGFVYEMLLAHEHQHNETMLQLLQMVECLRAGRGRSRARRGAGQRRARRWCGSRAGAHEIGAGPRPGLRLRQRAPAPRGRARRRSGSTARRSPTRAFVEFLADTGAEPPMYWERDGEGGWVRTAMGRTEAGRSGAARHPRLLARGRRLRRAGPASGCRPSSSGRRPPPAPTASAPTSTSSPSAAPRPAPTATPPPTAAPCRCSATSGSGPPATSPPTPASRPSPTPSTPRSSSATTYKVLRGGAWATRRRRDPHQLPQLGPARAPPDLLRHPLRQGR